MEDMANSNAGLMRRIVQLETEKDELRRDIERLCTQQPGFSGSIGIFSRMQAWRSAGIEQELEACKQKLALHTKDYLKLQEQLAETHQIKSRVADVVKTTMEKNNELEKEVKFYQSRMAGAFSERDKAYLELDKLQASEKHLINEVKELHNRVKKCKAKYSELKKSYISSQQSVETSVLELKRVHQVVEKFWQVRKFQRKNGDVDEELLDKVQALLEDDDAKWVYGSMADGKLEDSCSTMEISLNQVKEELEVSNLARIKLEEELSLKTSTSKKLEDDLLVAKSSATNLEKELSSVISVSTRTAEELVSTKSTVQKLEDELSFFKEMSGKAEEELLSLKSAFAKLKEELEQTKATSMDLKSQLPDARHAQKGVEETCDVFAQFAVRKETVDREMQELRLQYMSLKTMISTSLESLNSDLSSTDQNVKKVIERVKSDEKERSSSNVASQGLVEVPRRQKTLRVRFADESIEFVDEAHNQTPSINMEAAEIGSHDSSDVDDSKEILAQALHEKVEALLLLSQQEERYHLQTSTQSALEEQVSLLNQKLGQVTGEKVNALLELADARHTIQRLEGHNRNVTQWLEEQNIPFPQGSLDCKAPSSSGGVISQKPEDKLSMKSKLNFMPNGGYLKGWLRGLDISGLKSPFSETGSKNAADIPSSPNNSVSRLLLENTSLVDRLSSLHHIAMSVHHLRLKLAKVVKDSQGELESPMIESAIKIIESVKAEAKELRVAPGYSLPVSFQGSVGNIPENLSAGAPLEEILEESDIHAQDSSYQTSAALAGVEMAESLVVASESLIEALSCRLKFSGTCHTIQ